MVSNDASIRECCRPGTAWEGTPAGKEVTIAGFPAYASPGYESSQAPVVVLITGKPSVVHACMHACLLSSSQLMLALRADVFGWQQKNLRLYCDRLEQAAGACRLQVLLTVSTSQATP